MSTEKSNGYGKLFLYLLGLSFIVLKLCKVIEWSWWYVTLPIWGGAAIVIVGFGIYAVFKLLETPKPKAPTTLRKSKFQERLDKYMEEHKQ